MAAHQLVGAGHTIVPIGLREGTVAGTDISTDISKVERGDVDTVTLYVGPQNQDAYKAEIARIHPRRVIFNPGTVNHDWMAELNREGIETEEACTLVLLSTRQF